MWPFKKKPYNPMKNLSVEINAYGSQYVVYIWKGYNSMNPKIIVSSHHHATYSKAADEAQRLWNEIKVANTKLYG